VSDLPKYLPKNPVSRLIREAGAERVSEAAVDSLVYHMEKFAEEVAKRAVELARHAKRKTVTKDDIELAVESVWK